MAAASCCMSAWAEGAAGELQPGQAAILSVVNGASKVMAEGLASPAA
jgi:hypothetical protein